MITTQAEIIASLLQSRQITDPEDFLMPNYDQTMLKNNPFMMVDMDKAVERLVRAHQSQEQIVIFGDYDADGVTSAALLLDAFKQFGFKKVQVYLPDRFTNGYGLTIKAVEEINQNIKPDLIVTVDCGSLNHLEIERAKQLNIDVIVTDHHNLSEKQPPAVAVVNPKRPENTYPNRNLAGVGTAFTLVRALQARLFGLKPGQEKWLLDLVAIGTIADLMELSGENRVLAKFGLLVLSRTRRQGLKQLLEQAKVDQVSAEAVGFILGPRLNAAGRMDKAEAALAVLIAHDLDEATEKVTRLNYLNDKRRAYQDKIYTEACQQARLSHQPVLILKGDDWHEGVVGIVASRIQEELQKPTFILSEKNGIIKGSARSFGEFSIFQAIERVRDLLITGGGHDAAGGVSFESENFEKFKQRIIAFYKEFNLTNQHRFLEPKPEVTLDNFSLLDKQLYQQLNQFEPFGVGNPQPVFQVSSASVDQIIFLGERKQHLKIRLQDNNGKELEMISFNYNQDQVPQVDDKVKAIFTLTLNKWNGQEKLQGRLLKITEIKNS